MALVSMALHELGCPAISLTGSQAGIFTDSSHSNARISELRPIRVTESLAKNQVVVIAGFQGVDPLTKEVTTLGRGGSDTSAVALAAHFRAKRCEILKDVDGIFSADPKLVASPLHYSHFPLSTLEESCYWGAKVLHFRSVELARSMKVRLFIGSSIHLDRGTHIYEDAEGSESDNDPAGEKNMYEETKALTVTKLNEVHHLEVACHHPDEGLALLESILHQHQLAWPQILASAYEEGRWRSMISSTAEQIQALQMAIQGTKIRFIKQALSAITISCKGSYTSDFSRQVTACLYQEKIIPLKSLHSRNSISVFVENHQGDLTVQALHQLIK